MPLVVHECQAYELGSVTSAHARRSAGARRDGGPGARGAHHPPRAPCAVQRRLTACGVLRRCLDAVQHGGARASSRQGGEARQQREPQQRHPCGRPHSPRSRHLPSTNDERAVYNDGHLIIRTISYFFALAQCAALVLAFPYRGRRVSMK